MAEKFRSLLKTISGEINKPNLFNNARTTVNNATEKAQGKWNDIQNIVTAKYVVLAKQVGKDITRLQNLNIAKLEPSILPKKVVKWWHLYKQLTDLDKVEMAKHQVIIAQDILFKCQDERRNLSRQARIINNKLNEVYSELIQTRRDDPKYVHLTIMENKTLQDQARIVSELNLLEKEEKEHFTLLATAIKEYHDNQTISAQKSKNLSILASVVVAILSLICSMIYNANLRHIIAMTKEDNEKTLQNLLHSIENIINTKFTNRENEQKQPGYVWVVYGIAKKGICKIFGYS